MKNLLDLRFGLNFFSLDYIFVIKLSTLLHFSSSLSNFCAPFSLSDPITVCYSSYNTAPDIALGKRNQTNHDVEEYFRNTTLIQSPLAHVS